VKRLAAAAAVAACACAPAARAATPAVRFKSGDGLKVTSLARLDPRLYALSVTTPAVPATLGVRILLPAGYASHPSRRYPVLYLLDGTSGRASDWTVLGNAERTTAGKPLIVVMPDITIDGNGGGWCTNWPDGAQNWLTFHIDQLLPWVQANLRTQNTRGERAVAGLSQGGFCSVSYAALYPNLFGEVLAFSGAPEIAWDPTAHAGAEAIINATEIGLTRVPPNTFFGNPVTDYLNWAAHDPATLAENLRQTKMYLYFGNGLNGPFDTTLNPEANLIEGAIYQDNTDFHQRLEQLGIIPAVFDSYGNGTHSWPYWARDLSWSIGPLMADFAHPVQIPATFTYQTDSARYSLYGWSVQLQRLATEFSTLTVAGKPGFTLAGSGSATVTTPAFYGRRTRYRVMIVSQSGSTNAETVRTGRLGALTLRVPLGPSDTRQQYSLGGPPEPSPGTTVYTTHVTIKRVAR
jgi:S-formylglutathione hydrolase FrmB